MLWERSDFTRGRTPIAWNSLKANTHVAIVDGSVDTVPMGDLIHRLADGQSQDLIPSPVCCIPPDVLPFFLATHRGVKGRDLDR